MRDYKLTIKNILGSENNRLFGKQNFANLIHIISCGIILITIIPFIDSPIEFELDQSWIFFINKYSYFLNNNPYIFGLDVFFSYGPLGFILYPSTEQPSQPIAFFIHFLYWTLGAILVLKVIYENKIRGFNLIILSFSFLFLFSGNSNIFTLMFLLLTVKILIDPCNNIHYLFVVLCTACLMFYVKFSLAILYSSILFSLYMLLLITKKWRIKSRYTISFLFFYSVVLPTIYLIYSPSLKGLFQYFYYSFEISRGYSYAMSIRNDPALLSVSLSYILLFLMILVYLYKNGDEAYKAGLVFIPGLFFAFKSGFVRQDILHYPDFFNYYIISVSLLYLLVRGTKNIRVLAVMLISTSLFTGILFFRWSLPANMCQTFISSMDRLVNAPYEMLAGNHQNALNKEPDTALEIRIKQIIGNHEVVVIPNMLLLAYQYDFPISPMPVIQNYAAFTDKLDTLDSNFIEETRRNQFILFKFEAIDDRNPFSDTPMLWQSIFRWYDVRFRNEKFLLLERRSEPKKSSVKKIKTVFVSKNDAIQIPETDHQIIAKIYINYNLTGQITQFFYQALPIYMKIFRENGEEIDVRVITSPLRNGIFINFFPNNLEESYQLFTSNTLSRTDFIRFVGEGIEQINSDIRIDFYEVTNE